MVIAFLLDAGHGAFAKVSICSHKDTKEKFAVKAVQKNFEDPGKQREGGWLLEPLSSCPGSCSPSSSDTHHRSLT
jgi:hypothetical protein